MIHEQQHASSDAETVLKTKNSKHTFTLLFSTGILLISTGILLISAGIVAWWILQR